MIDIMLVEDDLVDVIAIERMFKKYQIVNPLYVAGDGLEALVIIDERNQSTTIIKENLLILLDFYMPRMDGLEFLAQIQTRPILKEIPVILFITSQEIKNTVKKCHSNIIGHLDKPINFSELIKLVNYDPQTQLLSI